jgi:hypothetical protein
MASCHLVAWLNPSRLKFCNCAKICLEINIAKKMSPKPRHGICEIFKFKTDRTTSYISADVSLNENSKKIISRLI